MTINESTTTATTMTTGGALVLNEYIILFMLILLMVVALLGVAANSINMVVFARLTSGDCINTSLLSLAVTDFGVCLTALCMIVGGFPSVHETVLRRYDIKTDEVSYLIAGVPHTIFARITILLTTLVTLERCLCVTTPLKVKLILSRERLRRIIVLAYFMCALVAIPIYYTSHIGWKYSPSLNKTVIGHVMTEDFYSVNAWFTPLDSALCYFIPFVVTTICTAVLITRLKKKAIWRQSFKSSASSNPGFSSRDKNIVKMVVIISSVFMFCYLPEMVMHMLVAFGQGFTLENKVAQYVGYFVIFLQTFNSSINIIFYYRNSSNYQDMFHKVFNIKTQDMTSEITSRQRQ